jgi:ketosteroid isomerase-like protein
LSVRAERQRAGYDAFNRGDFEALRDLGADDVEMRNLSSPEPLRGKDAVISSFEPDSFAEQRVELRELREHGDRIFAEVVVYGRGAASGVEVEGPAYIVYEYEGELVRRITSYASREEALAAAGL